MIVLSIGGDTSWSASGCNRCPVSSSARLLESEIDSPHHHITIPFSQVPKMPSLCPAGVLCHLRSTNNHRFIWREVNASTSLSPRPPIGCSCLPH
ncbi:hypothetical protein M405DRAFT_636786 [Rhizopogon salebrosus TDB-379]|nr:hypothetical protein M405DRAFT_636786 [Rhizopogon salebrosus TDB-379]